jgi:hypothetical protein
MEQLPQYLVHLLLMLAAVAAVFSKLLILVAQVVQAAAAQVLMVAIHQRQERLELRLQAAVVVDVGIMLERLLMMF